MISEHSNLLNSTNDRKLFNVPNVLYENRYCNQDDFYILVCGGYTKNEEILKDVYELKGANLECTKFPSMLEARYYCKTAVINSDILVVGGFNYTGKRLYSVKNFQKKIKSWIHKTELSDKRKYFCICSFKQNLYIVGGEKSRQSTKSCFVYHMKCNRWRQIADMNVNRENAACTVYEGKIVVSGGYCRLKSAFGNWRDKVLLKSVEVYEFYGNR